MIASFWGYSDIVTLLIEAKAQVNTQKEVYLCCSYHQKAHYHHTQYYYIVIAALRELTVFLSTGCLDGSSPGSSRRQS